MNRNLHTHRKGTSRDRLVVVQYYRNHIFNLFIGTFKYKPRVFDEKLDWKIKKQLIYSNI